MGNEQENSDNFDTLRARVRGPLAEAQRTKKQQSFLRAYRQTANITYSCRYAHIARSTFYDWRKNDPEFAAQLPDADQEANDTLELAAYDRAVNGVPSYVVSQGHLVYEEIPELQEDGTPKLDSHNKPIYKRGKVIMERKFSDTLLITLLKARMPQKYKEQSKIEHTGLAGGPIEIYKVRLPDNGRGDLPAQEAKQEDSGT